MKNTPTFTKFSSVLLVVAVATTSLTAAPAEARMVGKNTQFDLKFSVSTPVKFARPGAKALPAKPGKIRPISPGKPGVKMPNRKPNVVRPGGKPKINPGLPKNRPPAPRAGLDGKKGKAKKDFNKAAGVPKKAAPPKKRGLDGNKGRAKKDFNKSAAAPQKRGLAGNKGRAKRDFNFAAKPPGGNHGSNKLNHNPPQPKF